MPNYTYRCCHCQAVQSLAHGIHETLSPACEACGGLTERVTLQAPTVLGAAARLSYASQKKAQEQEQAEPAIGPASGQDEHSCYGACALHRPYNPASNNKH